VVRVADLVGVTMATVEVAVALGVGEVAAAPTATRTVARLESVDPSQAENVNASSPLNPASGKYVARDPLRALVPCSGCDTMRSCNWLPSGSVATNGIKISTPGLVLTKMSRATAGRLGLASSLPGQFTRELRLAWADAYALVASVMQRALARHRQNSTGLEGSTV